jgi:hypothetical protein
VARERGTRNRDFNNVVVCYDQKHTLLNNRGKKPKMEARGTSASVGEEGFKVLFSIWFMGFLFYI